MSIHYYLQPADPFAHIISVKMLISQPDTGGQIVSLPNWIPGSYMIRDFAKNIISIHAESDGKPVALQALDKSSWQAEPVSTALEIVCDVYAWDLSVRSAHCDQTHAYFNGTSVFLMAHGQEQLPCSLTLTAPDGEQYKAWKVASSLKPVNINTLGFGEYTAANYDELIDHPVEMGTFTEAHFHCADRQHLVAITGQHRADLSRLTGDLQKICTTHINMFGDFPLDIEKYVFQVMAVGEGYGGLEHRSSTSLLCSRNDLPLVTDKNITDSYRTFLALCSHEYFHTWNVKRIRPEEFTPYDLTKEVYTQQLWAFEGITSYYDELALVRSGVIEPASYLELLSQTFTRVMRTRGRHLQSVADSSFYAWNKFYKQDENAPNAIVSYYAKGTLVAMSLDLLMRKLTDNTASLDDVMRRLWNEYGKPGIGVPPGQIEQLATEIAGSDLSDFFTRYVYGTEDPPLQQQLDEVGVEYRLRTTDSVDDLGGKDKELGEIPSLGARVIADTTGARLSHVFSQGSAQLAGLSANDLIIAINGIKVSKQNLEKIISSYAPGETVTVHAFRRDELMQFEMNLLAAESNTCYLQIIEEMTGEQKQRFNAWLHQPA